MSNTTRPQRTALLIVVTLFVALLSVGCGQFELSTRAERLPTATGVATLPPPDGGATATTTPPASPFDATYRDEIAGFAIDYPSEWELDGGLPDAEPRPDNYTVTGHSWLAGPGGGGGIPEGGTKFDLFVELDRADSLDEAVANWRESFLTNEEAKILLERAITLGDGLPAIRFRVETNFGASEVTVTALHGHQILFGGLGDQALLNEIVMTLRPLPLAESAAPTSEGQMTSVAAIRVVADGAGAMVYSGPGTDNEVVALIPTGLALEVSGMSRDKAWYELAGCHAQNPYRPAPACWISTDQAISSPIRGIGPSQQPSLPTETRSILVLTDDMAPIYSGPADSYPVVSQLAGGFSFAVEGVSQDGAWWRLAECASPLNEPLDECWISADPSVAEPSSAPLTDQ